MKISQETKGFILGIIASVMTSVTALYIYQNYIAEKAATSAIQKYEQKTLIINNLDTLKLLSESELNKIGEIIDGFTK